MSFSPNKRKSERSERVSLWWKWHIFWLREGLKCFYLSREGNTGILLLARNSWHRKALNLSKNTSNWRVFWNLFLKTTTKRRFSANLTNFKRRSVIFVLFFRQSSNCQLPSQVIYVRARIKTFDWVRRRRVIHEQINRPTPLSFSFAIAVGCFDSDPGINEFMEWF